MSRSGYTDDCDDSESSLNLWRGAVHQAISGKRGQAMLREMLTALDAMPNKALTEESLVTADGEFCALGALGHARGMDMHRLDPDNWGAVAKAFGVAPALVREIAYENDDYDEYSNSLRGETPDVICARRWKHVRNWVSSQIKTEGEMK